MPNRGRPQALLAGKTVSYKDHIAVAGMPMRFGSFALEGFIPDFDATVVTRVLQEGTIIGKNVMNGLVVASAPAAPSATMAGPQPPQPRSRDWRSRPRAPPRPWLPARWISPSAATKAAPSASCGVLRYCRPQAHVRARVTLRDRIRLGPEHRLYGSMSRTVEDAAAALQATADTPTILQSRDVPTRIDVLGRLADGVSGLRIGVLEEGFDEAEADVRDLVMAAVDVLARTGVNVSKVSIPAHHAIRTAQAALTAEGALALFNTGFFGAFTRTYYPASLIAAINKMWAWRRTRATCKLALIAAELSRRNYHGRVYAKAQNVRPTYIKAYDAVLADVDVLVMPTCLMTAPKNHRPGSYLEAVEDKPLGDEQDGVPQHPALQLHGPPGARPSRGEVVGRSPQSACSSSGVSSTTRSSRVAMPTSTRPTGTRLSASKPDRVRTVANGPLEPRRRLPGRVPPVMISMSCSFDAAALVKLSW